jgi:hypothetical protein
LKNNSFTRNAMALPLRDKRDYQRWPFDDMPTFQYPNRNNGRLS